MVLRPNNVHGLNCYVDSDFSGNYTTYPDQDPNSVKSRTGYVILYKDCPVLWVSKMQTQCALSTMESEYIALSQSMCDLIPLREILKEIMDQVYLAELIPNLSVHPIPRLSVISNQMNQKVPYLNPKFMRIMQLASSLHAYLG